MMAAHKIALDPNHTQRSYFAQASGTARFAYNWALGARKKQYQAGAKPSEVCLRRQLNALKREQYRWMFDVTKCAVQEAIVDLAAFRAFFAPRCLNQGEFHGDQQHSRSFRRNAGAGWRQANFRDRG
jgi:putative transposase